MKQNESKKGLKKTNSKNSRPKKISIKTQSAPKLEFKNFYQRVVANLWVRRTVKYLLLPSLVYIVIFFIFQPQYLLNFSNGFYLDSGDGYQNVWNIWWVNEALVNMGTNPYFTSLLHWPHGTTLVPQTMNIFNGLVSIPLMNVFGMSLIQATNTMVVFSFFFSGVTMFWLVQKLYGNYAASLIAGGLFTFSTYHFAHAIGHLQLVSFEFIPLFIIAFITLTEKVRYRNAIFAALCLFLVMLCDYYYLFWSVIFGAMWFFWKLYTKELKINWQSVKVMLVFIVAAAILVLPLVYQLLSLNKHDPLLGFHDPRVFSLDPLAVFIPGGTWFLHELTSWHWTRLAFASETSIFFGYGLLTVLAIAFYRLVTRKRIAGQPRVLNFWWIVLFVFAALAMGPRLLVFGHTFEDIRMPYALLERIFPTLQLSGVPVRWILVSLIAAIIIASYFLSRLDLKTHRGKILIGLFIAVSMIDLYPNQLPLTVPKNEPYVSQLKNLPKGAVIDNAAISSTEQLYHQTIHHKPIAFGYVTRLPKSVDTKDFLIFAALEEGRHADLCKVYKIRYVTTPDHRPLKTSFPLIYQDKEALIYDMKNSDNC